MPKNEEAVIIFPQYAHSYDVRGGPDIDQLLAGLKNSNVTVAFTFLGYEGDSQITSDVVTQVNSVQPLDAERTVFKVGGLVVNESGIDARITIQRYTPSNGHGDRAAIFQ